MCYFDVSDNNKQTPPRKAGGGIKSDLFVEEFNSPYLPSEEDWCGLPHSLWITCKKNAKIKHNFVIPCSLFLSKWRTFFKTMKSLLLTLLCTMSIVSMDTDSTICIQEAPNKNLIVYTLITQKKIYYCTLCKCSSAGRPNWYHHKKSKKHCNKAGIVFDALYQCSICNYGTARRDRLLKHKLSPDHLYQAEKIAAQALAELSLIISGDSTR